MGTVATIAWWLVVLGAINTGLAALGYDLVGSLGAGIANIVYLLVGASGVYALVTALAGGKKKR